MAVTVGLALAGAAVWANSRAYAQDQPPAAAGDDTNGKSAAGDQATNDKPAKSKKQTSAERRKAREEAKRKARAERRKLRAERAAKAKEKKRAQAEAKKRARAERRRLRAERAAKAKAEKQAKADARRRKRAQRRKRGNAKAGQAADRQPANADSNAANESAAAAPDASNAGKSNAAEDGAAGDQNQAQAKRKRNAPRPSVAPDAGEPLPVLVISLIGESPRPDSAHPLTDILMGALTTRAGRPVEIRTGTPDTIDITGCSAKSAECFDAVADVIGVEWMVFGTVKPAGKDGVPVTITRVNAKERTYVTRQITLHSPTDRERREEFAVRVRAFLDDKPDPSAPYLALRKPADVPFGERMSRAGRTSWTVAGSGAVALAAGAALLSAAAIKQRQVDDAALDDVDDFERLVALERSGQRYTLWGNTLVVFGGIAAAVGVGLIIKRGYLDSPESRTTKLTIAPGTGSQGGVTVTLGGRF